MNENIGKISDVKVIRDNKNKKFTAWAKIDGKPIVLEDHEAIHQLLIELKEQENVKTLGELPRSMMETKFVYDSKKAKKGEFVVDSTLEDWQNKQDNNYRLAKGKLSRKSKYNGKTAKSNAKKKRKKFGLMLLEV